ncbi:MAG: hypothetical protein ISS92_01415 [Candidatus Omnitrophica bacterium]|nr:hypothetical protein [Candidatus Omnitrophota bacterium]
MRLKPRPTLVIMVSSLIIASVLALTIFGFYLYLEWKGKNIRRTYKLAIHDLNGQLYEKYILINLRAKIAQEGTFNKRPIIWGTIKNASNKKIYALRLRIAFYDPQNRVVYVDTFYPIGAGPEPLIDIVDITKNFLQEGDSISFTHQLKNCPPEVLNYLKSKLKFVKLVHAELLELKYKIEELDIR